MDNDSEKFNDQQLWEAFCYVAGEFSDVEEESFEQRMLEDGMLCEAVRYATMQTLAIASVQVAAQPQVTLAGAPDSVRQPARADGSRVIAGLLAVGCCLLLVVLASTFSEHPAHPAQVEDSTKHAELLVNFWASESRRDEVQDAENLDDVSHEIEVPEWLFAAVALPATDQGDRRGNSEDAEDWQ